MNINMMNLSPANTNLMTISIPSTDITVSGGDQALFAMMEVLASSSNTGEKDQVMMGKIYATAEFLSQLAQALEKLGAASNIQAFLKTYLAENGLGKGPLSADMISLLSYTLTTANADETVVDALNADVAKCAQNMKDFAASHNTDYGYWFGHAPWYVWLGGVAAVAIWAGAQVLENQKKIADYDAEEANQIKNDEQKIPAAMKAATLDMNRISSGMSIQGQKDTTLAEAQSKQDAREVTQSLEIVRAYSNICGSNNPATEQ